MSEFDETQSESTTVIYFYATKWQINPCGCFSVTRQTVACNLESRLANYIRFKPLILRREEQNLSIYFI